MSQPANPFAYPGPITLETLPALFAHHARHTAGWTMVEGSDDPPNNPGGDAGNGNTGSAGNAVDDKGRDLGFPKDTRVADMTDGQQAAYWRHQSQKHEGRYRHLTGDRSFDDVRKDLEDLAEIKKSQQTPAEQQLTERYEQGKKDAANEANTKAATAILRANLTSQGFEGDELTDLLDFIDVSKFVIDGEVDTDKVAAAAKRFTKAGTANEDEKRPGGRRRDFGGGNRNNGRPASGAAGRSALERRHGVKSTNGD